MADRTTTTYPPLGDESRFDAIVSRGRTLRRRHRVRVGTAGAGGAMAATALVVVLFAGLSPSSGGDPVIADQDDTPVTTTTTTTPSTDTTITIEGAQLPARVIVHDPVQPVATGTDPPAKQCVLVTLVGTDEATVGEGWTCSDSPSSGDEAIEVPMSLIEPGGPQVGGCSASVERMDPVTRETTDATSTFLLEPPTGLAAGNYSLRVEAVSGIGDGCPGTTPGSSEEEHGSTTTRQVVVP